VGKSERRTTLGRPKNKRDGCIKICLAEVGWRNMKWIDLAKNRFRCRGLVNVLMKPSVSIKCGDLLTI